VRHLGGFGLVSPSGKAVPGFSGRHCQGFGDGRLTGKVIGLFDSMSVTCVAVPSEQGEGVKDGNLDGLRCCIARWVGSPRTTRTSALPFMVGRDACTLLPVLEGSGRYRRAPLERTAVPLERVSLGSNSHPEYHGGGLLSASLEKFVQVVMPTLFAKSGLWG
jgi:hypothetical protein